MTLASGRRPRVCTLYARLVEDMAKTRISEFCAKNYFYRYDETGLFFLLLTTKAPKNAVITVFFWCKMLCLVIAIDKKKCVFSSSVFTSFFILFFINIKSHFLGALGYIVQLQQTTYPRNYINIFGF